jgi:cephalosporin hydroxylase
MRDTVVLNEPSLVSDDVFEVNGIRFRFSTTDYSIRTTEEEIAILKPWVWVDYYKELLERKDVHRVLEFGIFEGGMAVMLTAMKDDLNYLGVDLKPQVKGLSDFLDERPSLAERIEILYEMSQDDDQVPDLVLEKLGSAPVDLIIDDASHLYLPTKRTFELAFPLLKAGGTYIVEDWGWGHWPGFSIPDGWREEPFPTNLLFELSMACASDPALIERIEVYPAMLAVTKGDKTIPCPFALRASIDLNGREYREI